MKVSKRMAIFGFNLSASIFLGFCVYGLLLYMEKEAQRQISTQFWSLCALGIVMCIVGICYFGNQWDMHNADEARKTSAADGSNPKKRKKDISATKR